VERLREVLDVVAVDLAHLQAEGPPFVGEWLERHDLLGRAVLLDAVPVDDRHQVVELVVGRGHRRLPDRAFLAFAVAHHHERAVGGAVVPAGQGHSVADRQAVPEGAGGELDAGDALERVPGKAAPHLLVGLELLDREEAALGERRIEGRARVPLAEDQIVPPVLLRLRRIDPQPAVEKQHGQDLGDRHRSADVGARRIGGHVHDVMAQRVRDVLHLHGVLDRLAEPPGRHVHPGRRGVEPEAEVVVDVRAVLRHVRRDEAGDLLQATREAPGAFLHPRRVVVEARELGEGEGGEDRAEAVVPAQGQRVVLAHLVGADLLAEHLDHVRGLAEPRIVGGEQPAFARRRQVLAGHDAVGRHVADRARLAAL
jgi:hypothetical protein